MNTRTLLELKPSEILIHPANPRRDVGDVSELAASLKAHGLLQNLVVAPRPAGMKGPKVATVVLIAGHRRLAAAKRAKLDTVTVVLDEGLTDPADQLSAMLVENGQRADLSPVEEAAGYQALLDLKVTAKDVARRVSRPSRHVADRVKLHKLPDGLKERVHTHQVSLKEAMAITEFVDDDRAVETLTSALGSYNFEWAVQNEQRKRAQVEELAGQRRDLVTAGVTILKEHPVTPDGDEDLESIRLYELWEMGDLENEIMTHAGVDADDLEEEHVVAWHQGTCTHHAVVDEGARGFVPVCVNLGSHYEGRDRPAELADHGNPTAERKPDPAEAAREEAAEQLKADLATATVVRRQALAEAINVGSTVAARAAIVSKLERHRPQNPADAHDDWDTRSRASRTEYVRAFLGIPESATFEGIAARFEDTLVTGSLSTLTLLWSALDNVYDDQSLNESYGWVRTPYLRVLRDVFGYQWSDVERSMLPPEFTAAGDEDTEGVA